MRSQGAVSKVMKPPALGWVRGAPSEWDKAPAVQELALSGAVPNTHTDQPFSQSEW